MATGTIRYARDGDTHILKLAGELRYILGESFNSFLDRLLQRDNIEHILIDLTEAESIDSTILGLLARIAGVMDERFGRRVTLISSNDDINQLLDNIGFYGIFDICEQPGCDDKVARELPLTGTSADGMAATILEAHRILRDLNERNRLMFSDVVDALQKESR